MIGDEARAWRFLRRGDVAGETEEPVPLGTAVRDSRVPLRHDSNYLFVEREATAAEIRAELARLELPAAVVPGELEGADQRFVVMAHRGPVRGQGRAREVSREALEPLRRAEILRQPWGSPAVAEQLLAAKALIGERVAARFFAVYAGDEVAAAADLYLDPPDAQIEDVLTAEAQRGRGHGTALMATALAEAYSAGADAVFLVADADDWPKDWYARLGFEEIGRYVKVQRRR